MFRSAPQPGFLACTAVLLFLASAGRAADPHSLIPGDAKVILVIKPGQVFDAPLIDRDKPVTLRALLDRDPKHAKSLELKMLKQSTTALIALPSVGDARKIFVVLQGKFDPAAVRKIVTEEFKDAVKQHGEGATAILECRGDPVKAGGVTTPTVLYLAVPDETTCLVSYGSKDDLVAALAKKSAGTPAALRQLLEKNDKEAAISYALVNHLEGPLEKWKDIKRGFELFQGLHGWVRVEEEPIGQFVVVCGTEKDAQELHELMTKGLNTVTGTVAALTQITKTLTPALDVLRTVRVRLKDKQITVRGKLERDTLEDLIQRTSKPKEK